MLDTIIFDLDGTLLDTLDDLANSVNYALRTHRLKERSIKDIRRFFGQRHQIFDDKRRRQCRNG